MAVKQDNAAATLEGLRQIGSGWHLSVATAIARGDHKALKMDRKEFAQEAGGFKLLDSRQAIIDLHEKGMSRQAIGDVLSVDAETTVSRVLYEEGLITKLPRKANLELERERRTAPPDDSSSETTASRDGSVDSSASDLDEEIQSLRSQVEHEKAVREKEGKDLRDKLKKAREDLREELREARKEWESEQSEADRERLRKENEAWAEEKRREVMAGLASIGVQGVIGGLEEATEHLSMMVSEGGLTGDLIRQIEAAHAAFAEELNVARATIGANAS